MSFRPNKFQEKEIGAVFEACTSLQLNQAHVCCHALTRAAGLHGRLLQGAWGNIFNPYALEQFDLT